MIYAQNTGVSTERSKAEIERTLARYGATSFAYASRHDAAMVEFQANGKRIRFILPLPDRHAREITHDGRKSLRSPERQADAWEQACRVKWRALSLVVKAKLEAVASGITTLEQEFMAHIVLPGGKTVGDMMIPRIDEAYRSGKVPALGWETK